MLLLLTYYIPLQAGNAIFVPGAVPVLLFKFSSGGGGKKEVLVHNDPNSDARQAQQPPD